MKLKSILLTGLSFVLVAAVAIGGTLAYLTSTDSDVNVMTLGNVKIEQVEYERDANGALVEFSQAKPALPAVYDSEAWADEGVDVNGNEYKVFSENMKNVVDKIVTVNNTGKNDAYVRTLVAIEAPNGDPDDLIHFNYNSTDVTASGNFMANIDGVDYYVIAFTYKEALESGEKSAPSLMQLFLDKRTTNEDCKLFGDTWDILVVSQAVQTAGFDDAETALNTGFGEVNVANAIAWFSNLPWPGVLLDANDIYDASLANGTYTLANNINTSDAERHFSGYREYAVKDGVEQTLNLNGYTINHDGTHQDGNNTGYTYLYTLAYNGKLTVNGEGSVYSENTEGVSCIFYAQSTGEITINGGDYTVEEGVAVWAGNGSKITINGGSFVSNDGHEELIYSSGGVIDIYGGFFHNQGWEDRPVNVANANRGTGFINIYGGTFVNFDPSTGGDDPNNIKVADGYKVTSETQANGDVWYTVVAE